MTTIEYDTYPELYKAAIDFGKTILATTESYSFRIFRKGKTEELHLLKIRK